MMMFVTAVGDGVVGPSWQAANATHTIAGNATFFITPSRADGARRIASPKVVLLSGRRALLVRLTRSRVEVYGLYHSEQPILDPVDKQMLHS